MSDKERHEPEKPGPRKVKVTDRRRTSSEEVETAETVGAAESEGGRNEERRIGPGGVNDESRVRESEGSSTSGASGRSDAPLANEEPAASSEAPSTSDESSPRVGKDEAAELREHLQRMAADFDNYRKRVLREQIRAVEMASEPLIRRLLEVLDEFDLALIAAERKPDLEKFLHGVELVYAKLMEILRTEGLEKIEAEGKPFDPSLHEALMQSGESEGDPFVADVLRAGYTLRGRVIRPAGVKVVRK